MKLDIDAAIHSLTTINEANLENVTLTTQVTETVEVDDHSGTTSFILIETLMGRPPIFAATKWMKYEIHSRGSWTIFNGSNLTLRLSTQ